jgi:hypothetical protein
MLQFVLLIHAHQPVGNFDDVLERSYSHSYQPFVDLLLQHPGIRIGLHFSGPLLEWLEGSHPEYFDRLRELVGRGQAELVGGGFYEQILRLTDYLERHFGRRPRGAWLAERVWEPHLPSTLAPSGIEYTLVDDNHFLGAGLELDQLHGFYLAEDQGATMKVIPGLKALRYLIPYRSVEDTISFLRDTSRRHPGGMLAMGDDLEKFGVWPKTYEHVYRDGWLERFFSAVEANGDWLETAPPGDALATRTSLGRVDLPSASYMEMMEWALPTPARLRFQALEREFAARPEALAFLRGGIWQGFLGKYPESNLLHQKMLHVSKAVRRLRRSRRRGKAFRQAVEEAATLVLRSQCNDAYWHGIFGGLYAPHLRTELWRALVRAEKLMGAAGRRKRAYAETAALDFDADGHKEIYLTSDRYAALLAPADGGTICALDFRPAGATLINSLARRPEAYHEKLRQGTATGPATVAVSIHEQTRAKEEGLERWLRYDRWNRHAFRLLLFPPGKTREDFELLRLDEDAVLAGGPYAVEVAGKTKVALASAESTSGWSARKTFFFAPVAGGFEIRCDLALARSQPGPARVQLGLEIVLNMLAPSVPDRYFESNGQRYPLRWAGALPAVPLRAVDEWQKVSVGIEAPEAREFWLAPIETVSESEEGFERVYQGSQILAVWSLELEADGKWAGYVSCRVAGVA